MTFWLITAAALLLLAAILAIRWIGRAATLNDDYDDPRKDTL